MKSHNWCGESENNRERENKGNGPRDRDWLRYHSHVGGWKKGTEMKMINNDALSSLDSGLPDFLGGLGGSYCGGSRMALNAPISGRHRLVYYSVV
jgi:hypothetical protein